MIPANPRNEERLYAAVGLGILSIDREGVIWRQRHGETRRAEYMRASGHLEVAVMMDGIRHKALAHRLVWLHFNGPIPIGLVVKHSNGRLNDNRPANLVLVGLRQRSGRITGQQVAQMRARRARGATLRELAVSFGVSVGHASKVCRPHGG